MTGSNDSPGTLTDAGNENRRRTTGSSRLAEHPARTSLVELRFSAAGLRGDDCRCYNHSDEGETNQNIMHWGRLLCGSSHELLDTLIIGRISVFLNPTNTAIVIKSVLLPYPPSCYLNYALELATSTALEFASLSLPLHCHPQNVSQLDGPGDAIRSYQKFVTHSKPPFSHFLLPSISRPIGIELVCKCQKKQNLPRKPALDPDLNPPSKPPTLPRFRWSADAARHTHGSAMPPVPRPPRREHSSQKPQASEGL
jgi:hypothetical protein